MSDQATTVHRQRARDLGLAPGILSPGPLNAITDVSGVRVGHVTRIEGAHIRTGATAILPHPGNLYRERVPAGIVVGNGYGKLIGATQVQELGELETPIVLTNTLATPRAADAILDWTLAYLGNEDAVSINPLVGETNDSYLNDIRARSLSAVAIREAIDAAQSGMVVEGSVGAGTGTMAFGWKGGIGASSRVLPASLGAYTVGVLVQANFGGALYMGGVPIGQLLGRYYLKNAIDRGDADGSIMIIVATDAPVSDRNATRLAQRALAGLARTGAAMSNGSGDYVIAFSTAESVRRSWPAGDRLLATGELPNELMSPLFQAVIEATEEAIYNALCMATTVQGYQGHVGEALPLDQVRALLQRHRPPA
ncbi:MAG: P1 family peptidase [Chloroflexales bacterium]|nr:P1 family peptidase [Chloroflexales bacterium]